MYKLMIVDDERANLRLLERLFGMDYECLTASSGAEAIQLLQRHDVAVMLTDQRMPQMTGIELLKQTAELRPHMVRVLLTGYTDVEALVEAINTGLVYMYVNKPWNNSDLKVKISRAVEHYENNKKRHSLARANERLVMQLEEIKIRFISALTEALRIREEWAYNHAVRVSRYSKAIGEALGLRSQEQVELSSAALLHNVGHLATPDRILFEGQKLTEQQQEIYEAHSERGALIISGISEFGEMADAVRSHHENFDGTGYPRGLRGEQIPLGGRIIRAADEFDLLTQPRDLSYAISPEAARESMRARAGKDFDPRVINALIQSGTHMVSVESIDGVALHYA